MTDKAIVVRVHNPFNPSKDRQVEQLKTGFTIQAWVDNNPVILTYPIVCIVNGEPILRAKWKKLVVKKDDVVVFFRLPEGGGGGKNPITAALGIAIMVVGTVFTGGLLAVAAVAVGASLTVLGSGLLGVPEIPSTDKANQLAAPSPTYSLAAQGNSARIGEAIPVVYGHHQIYPDFASQPYSEFINNEQFLYHTMVIGQGQYELHKVRIEDTDIGEFEEIAWEKVEPGSTINLFSHNVVTALEVSGQELNGQNLGGGWVGPFIINPAETTTDKIAIDVNLPRGLYSVNNSGGLDNYSVEFTIQIRKIDEYGNGIGNWIILSTEKITANTNTAIRKTFKYDLTLIGRFEIRMKRLSDKSENTKIANEIRWSSVKAYLTDTVDYGDITLLAVKMKATNNLSNRSSRKINCIVTRKLPTWNPRTGWSNPISTSSICWALTDMLKAKYGAKMEDTKIDLQSLYDLDQVLSSRGDYLNAVYDRKMSLWEALKLACRVGRSAGILQGGIFRVVRDRQQSIPVAMFSTRNIIKDSFSIKYAMASEDTVDGVTIEFINPKTWKPDEISVTHNGTKPNNPAKVKLFGCTDINQARREAIYLARNNAYRRKTIKLTTELEGYIPTFGDLVIVSHDMPQWGVSGEIIGVDQDNTLILSEHIERKATETYYIAFRTRAGGVSGPWEVRQGSYSNRVRLVGTWKKIIDASNSCIMTDESNQKNSFRLYFGSQEERTHFTFGLANKWSQYGVVKSIRPRGDLKVEIQILSEDDRVHAD